MGNKDKARKKRKRRIKLLKKTFDIGIFLLIVLVVTFLLHQYVLERCEVHNHSMEPTLISGDIVLVDKLTYTHRKPKRYEIIIFNNKKSGEELVKRVIGLPGETVRIVQGKIFINEKAIDDIDKLDKPFNAGLAESDFKLEKDEYFVIGDNRKESIDSRYEEIGPVKRDEIVGKTLFRIKPIGKFLIK